MRRTMRWVGVGLVFSLAWGVAGMRAQQPVSAEPQAPSRTVQTPGELVPTLPVPRLVKFAGTLKDELGKARTGVVGVTFAVYKEQEGGAALWLETQNVELDEQGRYTVLLGSSKSEGLPLDLFSAGEPRWLGVQVNLPKELEQQRVLLVSVPYALKAADAEMLGGMPASAFVLAQPETSSGTTGSGTSGAAQKGTTAKRTSTKPLGGASLPAPGPISGSGTPNQVAKFVTDNFTITDSALTEVGGNVGIGTTSPARSLHIFSPAPTIRLADTHLPNSWWELQQSAFFFDTFGFLRYENGAAVQDKSFVVSSAGNIGLGTANPHRKLHIRSSAPTIRLEDSTLPNSFWELQQSAFVLDTFGFLRYENGAAVPSKSFVMSSAGNFGIGVTAPAAKLDVAGTGNFTGNTTAFATAIVGATQAGSTPPPIVLSPTTIPPVAVGGLATATSGVVAGVGGTSLSTDGAGVGALNFATTGGTALFAGSAGAGSVAVEALAGGTSGNTVGIHARTHDPTGVAALLDGQGTGNIIIGRSHASGINTNEFRVDGTGKGFFNGGTQTGGADFAESIAVRGERSKYEPGDLLVIDQAAGRRLRLSRRAYSTRVAGIYSTKPGVLATIHSIDESDALAEEIPLAIVGIVPCKVTAENGPIAPGDLLVTSSTPGYAMKGMNRRRMLGAVVGKALEPLREEKGIIQVLVTLQ
jgi:hypothetical protein